MLIHSSDVCYETQSRQWVGVQQINQPGRELWHILSFVERRVVVPVDSCVVVGANSIVWRQRYYGRIDRVDVFLQAYHKLTGVWRTCTSFRLAVIACAVNYSAFHMLSHTGQEFLRVLLSLLLYAVFGFRIQRVRVWKTRWQPLDKPW